MVIGLLVLALWQSAILARPAEWIAGFPLVLLAIPALLFALFTKCKRFLWYALLMLLAAVGLVINALEPYAGLLACGVVISVSGGVLLVRFLAQYPRAEAASE
jgi:hypothetical protein